jgi:hypothetical protein
VENFLKGDFMKFILAASIFVSSIAFAQSNGYQIKCYESAQQSGGTDLAYVLRVFGNENNIKLEWPNEPHISGNLHRHNGCLEGKKGNDLVWRACLGEGQNVYGLVPVEVMDETYQHERTVYCNKKIRGWMGPVFE